MELTTKPDNADSQNVRDIFTAFEKFIEICENDSWPNNVTGSHQVCKAYKIANFIERCIQKLDTLRSYNDFMNSFTKWTEIRGKNIICKDKTIFSKSADCILEKFLVKDLETEIADNAISEYLRMFGEKRLQCVLKTLILKSASYNVVEKYANEMEVSEQTENNLKCELFLNHLNNKSDSQVNIINNMLRNDHFDLFENVQQIFNALNFNGYAETKKIMEQCVLNKLMQRDKCNSKFWLWLLKDLDKVLLYNVCKNFKDIFKEIILFIIHCSGHMMHSEKSELEEDVWINNTLTSLCPDLTYKHLINVVKLFTKDYSETRDYFLTLVNDSFPILSFWNSVYKDCGISNELLWKNLDTFYDEDIFLD